MEQRRKKPRRAKRKSMKYFFSDGRLYRTLHASRAHNVLTAWSYDDAKRVRFVYTTITRTAETAYSTVQVGAMIGRHPTTLKRYISEGCISAPPMSETMDERREPVRYFWRKSDIYALHDYLLTVHMGAERKDGLITPTGVPSRSELRSMMDNDVVFYVKNADGEMVPSFKETIW